MQETLKNLAKNCLEKVKLSASAGKPTAFSADEKEFLMELFLMERNDLHNMETNLDLLAEDACTKSSWRKPLSKSDAE